MVKVHTLGKKPRRVMSMAAVKPNLEAMGANTLSQSRARVRHRQQTGQQREKERVVPCDVVQLRSHDAVGATRHA